MVEIPATELGELGRVIVRWANRQQFPPDQAKLARAFGVSKSTVSNWLRGKAGLVKPGNLERILKVTRLPFEEVRDAILYDLGYPGVEPPIGPPTDADVVRLPRAK